MDGKRCTCNRETITKLDLYLCRDLNFIEHIDADPDMICEQLFSQWQEFYSFEKEEILLELSKMYKK